MKRWFPRIEWFSLRRYSTGYKTSFTVYNSVNQQYETLTTAQPHRLTWYVCGPTVYDDAHLGHARTYLCLDIIRRIMERRGVSVLQVMNITDVDDKILQRSKERQITPQELTTYYRHSFMEDMSRLSIKPPTWLLRVSDFIPNIIAYIQRIIHNGYAYKTADNDIYFDIMAFCQQHTYGKLQPLRQYDPLLFDDETSRGKKHVRDFVLWKSQQEEEKETMKWPSPWGRGRPGWHIECSSISK
jgi:cysteinyl-tRNA synthetase